MRKILIILLASLLLPSLYAQELSSILEAHYKAAAQEKMQKIKTMITSGINTFTTGGIESTFMIYQARPHMLRVESTFQGSKVIQTYNGESAWKYAPAMGIPSPVEITGGEKEVLLQQADFESRLWNYAEKEAEIELIESRNDEAIHLLFKTVAGDFIHYHLDRESYLISSIVTSQILGGSEAKIELVMEEYKTVKGIPIAHRGLTRMNGQVVVTLEIQKVEINRKIDPVLFEKPISTPSN
jgi:outer membrane lipoprotein-sorting protein